jgi:hypothetical protein
MDWPKIERAPEVGDVLWHEHDLLVLVLRKRATRHTVNIDVLWLWCAGKVGGVRQLSSHNGELSTWHDWQLA